MAPIWDLPVIFLCENNQYAMSMAMTPLSTSSISQRACAYNIPGVTVDGNDYLSVYDVISQAAQRAREGQGPTLVESITYRWRGHSRSDRQLYRTRDEVKEWQAQDPIPRFAARLIQAAFIDQAGVDAIKTRGYQRIEEAMAFAEASPEPDVAMIMEGVYAD
jgi:pyruvate dehydrogenase E1 component alpha subunit